MSDEAAHLRPKPDTNLDVETADGHRFRIMCFQPEARPDAAVVLCWPAMGTRARNYKLLAEFLRARGLIAAVGELRGHGTSSIRAGHRHNFGYREMLMQDWQSAQDALEQAFPGRPIYLLGHSLSGQLSLLYAALFPERVAGVVLMAAGSAYHRCYGRRALPLRLLLGLIRPLVTLMGYFPGERLGFARREGAQVMLDWAHQSRTGRYRVAGASHDFEYLLSRMRKPVLALEIVNDQLAPPQSVTHLLKKLDLAAISRYSIELKDARAGREHFDWFMAPKPVAEQVKAWIEDLISNKKPL